MSNARTSDSGIWGCEMVRVQYIPSTVYVSEFWVELYFHLCQESYKFGGGRGSGYIVRGGVEVCDITFYCLLLPTILSYSLLLPHIASYCLILPPIYVRQKANVTSLRIVVKFTTNAHCPIHAVMLSNIARCW